MIVSLHRADLPLRFGDALEHLCVPQGDLPDPDCS